METLDRCEKLGLKNCKYVRVKNVHANFQISLISKILKDFTEMFYTALLKLLLQYIYIYSFVKTRGMRVHFSTMIVFKCCTKLDRFKFRNSAVLLSFL